MHTPKDFSTRGRKAGGWGGEGKVKCRELGRREGKRGGLGAQSPTVLSPGGKAVACGLGWAESMGRCPPRLLQWLQTLPACDG